MNKDIWNCPVCEYRASDKNLKEKHIHEEFDRKYDELERLSTETAKENINKKINGLFGNYSDNSGSFISGYKNIISFYKSI